MSRRSGGRADTDRDAFPLWDEPEGRRRRAKKRPASYRKTEDGGRTRRPHYEEESDWDSDYDDEDDSDWAADDDELDLAEALNDDGEWDDAAGWDREDEGESDGEDWRSRDD